MSYLSTNTNEIQVNQPIRDELAQLTEAYLNQGKTIQVVGSEANARANDPHGLNAHNLRTQARVQKETEQLRALHLADMKAMRNEGRTIREICEKFDLTVHAYLRVMEGQEEVVAAL